ncbi:receptor-like protein 12 isoform X2 [Prunus yedoensis var. nudiflora]|uniref:Receptor-like protein 12 isoform X2 n=1 Tax=Prunus yedoensis var. nudiflora TaxID=2094558 RepID=A0A314ZRV0_PRUYE|nr:receptor-like protein 12 isoform X2 [Prunus yedoensis var. nudiflora]
MGRGFELGCKEVGTPHCLGHVVGTHISVLTAVKKARTFRVDWVRRPSSGYSHREFAYENFKVYLKIAVHSKIPVQHPALNFSINNISGSIPKCLNNLTTLAQKGNPSLSSTHTFNRRGDKGISPTIYEDDASFIWKGRMRTYKSTLGLVKRIDLSSNRLTGEIPSEITHLVGLISLNLSRNQLTSQITPKIGNLQSLDSLDLSRNQMDGGIPTSLAQIDRLSFLDLSYNNLSGKIPLGTQLQGFDPSVYVGNPQLCGPPLKKMCADQNEKTDLSNQGDKDELITLGFYISMGLGFAVGFWRVCGTLIFNRSWRYAYLKFLNGVNDWLYVRVALIKRQLKLAYA